MERIEGRTFGKDDTVAVAGKHFVGCRFDGAIIEYDGSSGGRFDQCSFVMCGYRLVGPALGTVHFLHFLSKQEPDGPSIVSNLLMETTGGPQLASVFVETRP